MVQVTEAVFSQGVLKPVDALQLREQQRVRLIIEAVDGGQDADRAAALKRLRAGIASMRFPSSGPLPTRDELQRAGLPGRGSALKRLRARSKPDTWCAFTPQGMRGPEGPSEQLMSG